MSGRFDPLRVEYLNRTSQFSDANLVHRYIENSFITERLSIYIDDVKKTLSNLHCFQHAQAI